MVERAAAGRGEQPARPVVGSAPVGWYEVSSDCCPNLRDPGRPALCQAPAKTPRFEVLAVPARATDRWAQTTLRSGNFRHVVAL